MNAMRRERRDRIEKRRQRKRDRQEASKIIVRLDEPGPPLSWLGKCRRAALRAGWTREQWDWVRREATCGDWETLLRTLRRHFDLRGLEGADSFSFDGNVGGEDDIAGQ